MSEGTGNNEALEAPWGTRFVLLFGIIAGIAYTLTTIQYSPDQLGIASRVYYYAATAAMDAENFYRVHPPSNPGYRFLYPPIVVLVFYPHVFLGSPSFAYALQCILNSGAIMGIAFVLITGIERRDIQLSLFDKILLAGFIGVSPYGITQLIQGQVTLWLAFAISLGVWYLDTNADAITGFLVALPAIVKLFPSTLGLYFIRTRKWNTVGTALLTGVAALLLGSLAFGRDLTVYYFLVVLPTRLVGQTPTGPPDPSHATIGMTRQLAAIFPGATILQYGIALFLATGILAILYRSFSTDIHHQSALLATLILTLLILPLDPLYFSLFIYPLGILLFTNLPAPSRAPLLIGTILTTTLIGYPTIKLVISTLPIPTTIQSLVLPGMANVLSVILPPTLGLYLLLISCLTIHLSSNHPNQ